MPVISTENLTKVYRVSQKDPGLVGAMKALFHPRYQEKVALDHVSFSVEARESIGYIGLNGAGKSTTIKLLTGILRPSGGHVRVLGRDPFRQRVANAREIGVAFGQRTQLWWDLAVSESFDLLARLYDLEPVAYRRRLDEFGEVLGLGEFLKVPVRNLSLGQRMRAELVAALIHEPRIIYLDEPTIGLDILVKERLRALIRKQHQEREMAVILTTHDLSDIEDLCDRVLIIESGRLVYDGSLDLIKQRFGKHRLVTLEVLGKIGALDLPDGAEVVTFATNQQTPPTRVAASGSVLGVASRLTLRFDRNRLSASEVAAAVMSQIEVVDLTVAEPDLESIIKEIYRGALRESKERMA